MRKLVDKFRGWAVLVLLLHLLSLSLLADPLDDEKVRVQSLPKAPLISRNVIMQRPPINSVELSPDGKHIAYVVNHRKYRELWWTDLTTGHHQHVFSSTMINGIDWSADNSTVFLRNRQGVSTVQVDKPASARFVLNLEHDKQDFYFGVDNTQASAFLFSRYYQADNEHVIYRVDADGAMSALLRKPFRIMDFLQDEQGNIQFYTRHNDSQFELWRRHEVADEKLFECADFDACSALSFDGEANRLLVRIQRDLPQSALYEFSLNSKKWQLLHADPKSFYSLNHTILDPKTDRPVLAGYRDEHFSYYALDNTRENLLAHIYKKLQSPNVFLQANDTLDVWLLIDANPARAFPRYYVYSTQSKTFTRPLQKKVEQLVAAFPTMPEDYISAQIPIYYKVSDGMKQQGYVTLPRGADLSTVPLVVVPHGGPWGRTNGNYDARTQFLVNRGYAVFQPNFRASTGFGRQYVTSANKDFGKGRVHQDIIDGMHYVLGKGIGDETKLAIYGHSFGGFSVLGALAFDPQLFQVGIAGAAPVDLVKAVRNFAPDALDARGIPRHDLFKHFAVDINDDEDVKRLTSQSPDAYWEQVAKPLYMTAGGRDDRVSILNVRDYALRLHQAGKPISLLEDPNEGHSFRQDLAMEAYFYILEKALSDHVGGQLQSELSDKLQRYLQRKLVLDRNGLLPN